MGRPPRQASLTTQEQLLQAALVSFAQRGYAATSVQEIVDAAKVSKPALYYYFTDKAHLFQALVDKAHDARYELMRGAAEKGLTIAEKLEHMLADVFEWSVNNHELMRLAVATAFNTTTESPGFRQCQEKGRRNYEFVRDLIAQAQSAGELDSSYDADALAMGIYGQLNIYVMVRLLTTELPLDRESARTIVRLFLNGALPGPHGTQKTKERKRP